MATLRSAVRLFRFVRAYPRRFLALLVVTQLAAACPKDLLSPNTATAPAAPTALTAMAFSAPVL